MRFSNAVGRWIDGQLSKKGNQRKGCAHTFSVSPRGYTSPLCTQQSNRMCLVDRRCIRLRLTPFQRTQSGVDGRGCWGCRSADHGARRYAHARPASDRHSQRLDDAPAEHVVTTGASLIDGLWSGGIGTEWAASDG